MAGRKKVVYPLSYNPILEYWNLIESGEEVVSNKIHEWYKHLAWEVNNPGEYFYSPARANHVLEFAENYPKGPALVVRCDWNFGRKRTWLRCLALWISMVFVNAGSQC